MVETGSSSSITSKIRKYEYCYNELESILNSMPAPVTEVKQQKALCEVLARAFKESFNFVGFYDMRPEVNPRKVFIGEFVSELVFPCGEIDLGKG